VTRGRRTEIDVERKSGMLKECRGGVGWWEGVGMIERLKTEKAKCVTKEWNRRIK
jgi:hypothetical protein